MAALATLTSEGEGKFVLSGELNFDSVPSVLEASRREFADNAKIAVDLSGVTRANSAGMALLLEWRAISALKNTALNFDNIPENLRQIAQVCDVLGVIDGD
ncbi:MAG: STAS domain-containing protein [Pseudomonadota bacterium]